MDLDRIQTRIRPRSTWEAVDLGFVLARTWFWHLWLAWVLLAAPVFVVTFLLFWDKIWVASIVLWWFKPLYEQPLLFIISRQLFAEKVSVRYLRQHLWSIVKPQLLANLTWRRFSLNRSFNNPVSMLEGLSGQSRKKRLVLLHKEQSLSVWLTIIGAHIESIFNLSLLVLISMLVPDTSGLLELNDFFNDISQHYQVASWINSFAFFLSLSVFAPFYVAAGFSLYLHSRVQLEGWEIEITFKQLKQRVIKKIATSSLNLFLLFTVLVCAGSLMPLQSLQAQEASAPFDQAVLTSEQARKMIAAVLEQDEFGHEEAVTRWRLKSENNESTRSLPEWMKGFIEWLKHLLEGGDPQQKSGGGYVLKLLLGLMLVGVVVILWKKYGSGIAGMSVKEGGKQPDRKPPEMVSGGAGRFDLESLPSNIPDQVQKLIKNGCYRQAMSLLYRGALRSSIQLYQVKIPPAATEMDCYRIIANTRPLQEVQYFYRLSQYWQKVAYAHARVDPETVMKLLQDWLTFYMRHSR